MAAQQAVKANPNDASARFKLGESYRGLARYQEAIDAYKQAIRIKPDHVEAHFDLGLVYNATGDKGLALEQYKILQKLDRELANKLINLIYPS